MGGWIIGEGEVGPGVGIGVLKEGEGVEVSPFIRTEMSETPHAYMFFN